MKRALLAMVILCLLPVQSYSHPGKTNRYGGHKCVKGCEEWGLFYNEYHLHDKYGRPIRISRKKAPSTPVQEELYTETTATLVPEPISAASQTVTVYRYVTNVYEENIFASSPLLWVLLVLLLLLLILRRNRKEPENLRS